MDSKGQRQTVMRPWPTLGDSAMCHCKLHCLPEFQFAMGAIDDVNGQVSFLALKKIFSALFFLLPSRVARLRRMLLKSNQSAGP